jgi:transaldolase
LKLYLDTAEASQWRLPAGCPAVQGVTTNPTLIHAAGLPVSLATCLGLVERAGQHGLAELMLQLPEVDPVEADRWLARLLPVSRAACVQITIKLPCHPDWQGALARVQAAGVPTLLTGVSNPVQLMWARQCGATYVAPYIGRLQADGRDVWPFLKACVALQDGGPRLLAASIKSSDVLSRLIAMGAYAATVRPEFAAGLATDKLTDAAIAQFDTDTKAASQRK